MLRSVVVEEGNWDCRLSSQGDMRVSSKRFDCSGRDVSKILDY